LWNIKKTSPAINAERGKTQDTFVGREGGGESTAERGAFPYSKRSCRFIMYLCYWWVRFGGSICFRKEAKVTTTKAFAMDPKKQRAENKLYETFIVHRERQISSCDSTS